MLIMVVFLAACTNSDGLITPQFEDVSITTVQVVDGKVSPLSRGLYNPTNVALSFPNQKSVEDFMSTIANMTREERLAIVHDLGITTLYDLAAAADKELDSIGNQAKTEAEFRVSYSKYVEKYRGLLVNDEADILDLSLYVPGDDDVETYIYNSQGKYVVDGKIVTLEPAKSRSGNIKPLNVANASETNKITFEPASKKKVTFELKRCNEDVHLKTKFQKKMWWGWKGDSHHEIAFEIYANPVPANTVVNRSYIINKADFEADIMKYPIDRLMTGEAYIWTDYSYEHDANNNVIMEVINNVKQPKCLKSKAKIINVQLSKNSY